MSSGFSTYLASLTPHRPRRGLLVRMLREMLRARICRVDSLVERHRRGAICRPVDAPTWRLLPR